MRTALCNCYVTTATDVLEPLLQLLLGLPYFEKQKSGHRMTNFHETKFMASPTFFLRKAGRCVAVPDWIVEVWLRIRNLRRKLG